MTNDTAADLIKNVVCRRGTAVFGPEAATELK